jgi:hypothetical protein
MIGVTSWRTTVAISWEDAAAFGEGHPDVVDARVGAGVSVGAATSVGISEAGDVEEGS